MTELDQEQRFVATAYARLDALRAQTAERRDQALTQATGAHQAAAERESTAIELGAQLADLDAVEQGLCFGRLDLTDGQVHHIGRLGLRADDEDHTPLLIDWRAPAARPFYTATALRRDGVRRRRHLTTSGRRVVSLHDEQLDQLDRRDQLDLADAESAVAGEAALLAAVTADHTGRMGEIVATIQAEQDAVIRADHRGVLVVQGGPGTGKTAVALHRAAYLLYTHRERLARRVVLIVGPNPAFLRYIEQVLPSLGETGVRLATIGELYPGLTATAAEPAEAAELKGRPAMLDVLERAVCDRQWVPEEPLQLPFERQPLPLTPTACRRARDLARASGELHNAARPLLEREIVAALTEQYVRRIGGAGLLDEGDLAEIRRDLRATPELKQLLDQLWPLLTPQRLLTELFGDRGRIATAAPEFTAAERALLHRAADHGWTPADVPLLDEAAELLGADLAEQASAAAREATEQRQRLEYAQEVLDIAYGSRSVDLDGGEELLSAFDLVDAERLAERHRAPDLRSPAERAAADRTWVYGHIIVDEAQELSAMAWRLLMRRCPSSSMTLVGDLAQTGDRGGASSWQRVLEPYVGTRWRLAPLTVNYRTPSEIARPAAEVLRQLDSAATPPRAVRDGGIEPWRTRLADSAALGALVIAATRLPGRCAVIVPRALRGKLDLDARAAVLTVAEAKGLEFDTVLTLEPAAILAESPRGLSDLYVALTRATRRLAIGYFTELPEVLAELPDRTTAPHW
ncbi:DNA helicase IV [Kitasatospora sp. GP30]|uniref:HelD family protein n=1 Tax=Kitasatospora sp. GP30 TaxID=3035084 RepID=UPI000CC03095|nr:AAA family ATPase [Kitasatospora sp. GP30]MDH6139212.1 DNA helicase IV [Kitasatospora sp. GP30]